MRNKMLKFTLLLTAGFIVLLLVGGACAVVVPVITQLTFNTVPDMYSSISGDGSTIAFSSRMDGDWEIFVVNSDGTGLTQLTFNTENDYVPSISNDGSKIAFFSLVDGDNEIFLCQLVPDHVIPEIPLGTVIASAAMIIALVAYAAKHK